MNFSCRLPALASCAKPSMSSKKGGKKDAGAPPPNAAYDALKGSWQTQAHEIIHERFPHKIVHLTRLLADSPLFSAARIANGGDEARR